MSVYLDYNATAPVKPVVLEAMRDAYASQANPSSVHRAGVAAKRRMNAARAALADYVNADPAHILFTSGGTEANNQVLRSFADVPLVISAIEHDSIRNAAPHALRVGVTRDGVIDLAQLERTLAALGTPALVSVMLVNNETGVIQPIAEVVRITKRHGGWVHTDAVQAFGKLPLNMASLGVDLMTLCPHKVGGMVGVGAIVAKDSAWLESLLLGGAQEQQRRAGTENVGALAGWHALLGDLALPDSHLQTELEQGLRAIDPNVDIIGANAPRVANTTCVRLAGMKAETQVMALDLASIAVSAGAACSSGKVTRSPVLEAMGYDAIASSEAIRISTGWATKPQDINIFLREWQQLWQRTQRKAAA